ncbi:MAG: SRPBCC family protein [Pseudomonadota bacterium]
MVQLAQIEKTFGFSSRHVYQYVVDMENYGNWFPGVIDIHSVDELPPGTIGKRYLERIEFPTGPGELNIEVKQATANERFVTEGDLPQLLPRMTVDFTDVGDGGCRLLLTYESRHPDVAADRDMVDTLHRDLMMRGEIALLRLQQILLRQPV